MFEVVVRCLRSASLLWLVLAAVTVQGCAGGSVSPAGRPSLGPTLPAVSAGLGAVLGSPPVDPSLSPAQIASKRAQINVLWNKQGVETYTRQQGCVADSEAGTLSLLPEAGRYTCAVYQFQFLLATDRPLSLSIVLSQLPRRYYVGLSSYSMRRWDWHAVDVPTGNDYIPIPQTQQCINAGGALYVAIAGYDRDWLTVSQVRLETNMQAPPPVGLTASQGLYGDKINLSWTSNNEAYPGLGCDGVVIERANNPAGPYLPIGEAANPTSAEYTDNYDPLDPLHNYAYNYNVFYRLRNRTGVVVGPPGGIAAGYRMLGVVDDLIATKGGYADRVRLNWSDVAGAENYDVQCRNIKTGPQEWTTLNVCDSSTFDHFSSDTVLPCQYNTVYEYRVLARLGTDTAAQWSNTDSGLRVLRDVSGLVASKGTYDTGIRIIWLPVSGATGYNLYYKPKWPAAGAFTLLTAVAGASTTEFMHSSSTPALAPAQPGTAYEYAVKAVLEGNESQDLSTADFGFFGPGAWPQFRHDARHSGLSPLSGPQTGASTWGAGAGLTGAAIDADPVVGPDQSVTVGSADGKIYTFNPDGSVKWQFQTGGALWGSPAVDREARVFASCYFSSESQLIALAADGTMLWHYPAGGSLYEGRGITSPTLGPDGRIVTGSMDNKVYMVWSNGLIGWTYDTGAPLTAPPAMADDGTVYAMSSDGVLCALSIDGIWLWEYDTLAASQCAPTIDATGRIIVGNDAGKLLALNPDGTLAWSCSTGVGALLAGPALGPGGECYATGASGRLCALDTAHVVDWSYLLSATEIASATQPAVDADGLIYSGGLIRLAVLQPDGSLSFDTPLGSGWQLSSPALGPGLCYMGEPSGQLRAFGATL